LGSGDLAQPAGIFRTILNPAGNCCAVPVDVCSVCYKFLQTIYDKKKMKEVRLAQGECKSMYHKKLTDSFKS
jgi:hypothetical protein